jgi:Tfp pilus assembly protein PilO
MTLSKNKLNTTQNIFIVLAIFFISILLIIYLLIFPSINNIKNLRISIVNQKIDEATRISKEKNMDRLNEKLKKIEPELEQVKNIFLVRDRELEFITALEGIADKDNISQKINLNTDTATNLQQIKKIPITITITGTFQNFIKYLNDLENLRYYININTVNLASTQNMSSGAETVTAQISALTYWQ